jgi:hypothetical protein
MSQESNHGPFEEEVLLPLGLSTRGGVNGIGAGAAALLVVVLKNFRNICGDTTPSCGADSFADRAELLPASVMMGGNCGTVAFA